MPPLSYAFENEQHSNNFWSNSSNDYSFSESYSPIGSCEASLSSTPRTTKIVKRKSVSFFESVEVYDVLHINNYTEAERRSSWHGESDLQRIRNDARQAVSLLEQGELRENGEYCGRGLEHHTHDGSRQRMQTRCSVWDAVLDEQERQALDGVSDPDQLFTQYHYFSVHCSIQARRIALFDERDAK